MLVYIFLEHPVNSFQFIQYLSVESRVNKSDHRHQILLLVHYYQIYISQVNRFIFDFLQETFHFLS